MFNHGVHFDIKSFQEPEIANLWHFLDPEIAKMFNRSYHIWDNFKIRKDVKFEFGFHWFQFQCRIQIMASERFSIDHELNLLSNSDSGLAIFLFLTF